MSEYEIITDYGKDLKRKQILEKLGYIVIYLWSHEFPFYKDEKVIFE